MATLSLHCCEWASPCGGFSFGGRALECGLSSCGSCAWLPHGMWVFLDQELNHVPCISG